MCFVIGAHTPKVNKWEKARHGRCIMTMVSNMQYGHGPLDATMQGMTTSLATLTDTMPSSNMLVGVDDEKKTKDFKKLGAHHNRMILNASTVDVNLHP
jgi:hypothetical protein